jgi:DNA-directed RNA polymerase subunit RPC12/RpoP
VTGRLRAVPDLPPDDGPDETAGTPGPPAAPGEATAAPRSLGLGPETPADPPEPATFRVRCPDCGPQIIPISAVRFVQTRGGDDASANRYVFTCPQCRSKVRRPAGPELAEILRASGVATLALHQGSGEPV